MRNLKTYVDSRINSMAAWFGDSEIDVTNLNEEDAQRIFDSLDGDLSPEHLHCDGEISPAEARKKANLYYAAGNELVALGYIPKNSWSEFA